jgi:hypothetical protein
MPAGSTVQRVLLVLRDDGCDRRQLNDLMAMRLGIFPPQRLATVLASLWDARNDHLNILHCYKLALVFLMAWLPARLAPRRLLFPSYLRARRVARWRLGRVPRRLSQLLLQRRNLRQQPLDHLIAFREQSPKLGNLCIAGVDHAAT